jgi:hypothetical protein
MTPRSEREVEPLTTTSGAFALELGGEEYRAYRATG